MNSGDAAASHPYPKWTPGADAVIEWGIKRSLIGYMASDSSFEWHGSRGASFSIDTGATLPAVVAEDGTLQATGDLVLTGHKGALTVPLVDLVLEARSITIADPVDGPPDRLELVTVAPLGSVHLTGTGAVHRFSATLSREADGLFLYNYLPGVAFDDLLVRFPS